MKSERMVMRFEGDNDIDLETLTYSLNSTVNAIKEMGGRILTENDYCKFKVTNIKRGSFVITIDQIIELAPSFLGAMPTVIEAVKQVIEIRKFLKGMPPKEVVKNENNVEIKDNHGNIYNANSMIFNFYTNKAEKELANVAKTVLMDKERQGLKYEFTDEHGNEDIIEMNKEELVALSTAQDVESFDKKIEENEMITYVKVRKPDLVGNSKWMMTLNGKNIECDMADQNFLDRVHNNEIPFKGDTKLKVKIIIRYKTDYSMFTEKTANVLSRSIVEVIEVVQNDFVST